MVPPWATTTAEVVPGFHQLLHQLNEGVAAADLKVHPALPFRRRAGSPFLHPLNKPGILFQFLGALPFKHPEAAFGEAGHQGGIRFRVEHLHGLLAAQKRAAKIPLGLGVLIALL